MIWKWTVQRSCCMIADPDFLEFKNGTIAIMETNKRICRLHLINPVALAGLFNQHNASLRAARPAVSFNGDQPHVKMPVLPSFVTVHGPQQGFSIELTLGNTVFARPGDVLLDTRSSSTHHGEQQGLELSVPKSGEGLALTITAQEFGSSPGTLSTATYTLDPACAARLSSGDSVQHHVTLIADAGPLVGLSCLSCMSLMYVGRPQHPYLITLLQHELARSSLLEPASRALSCRYCTGPSATSYTAPSPVSSNVGAGLTYCI